MIHIGFTGTQLGYNAGADIVALGERGKAMFRWLAYLRLGFGAITGHHGDCVGADKDFHNQCLAMGIPRIIHPPDIDAKRAFAHQLDGKLFTITAANTSTLLPPLPYLERNRAIVDQSQVMLAAPRTVAEEQRSGTWSTVRYARRAQRWIIIIQPDGDWRDEGQRPSWCDIRRTA